MSRGSRGGVGDKKKKKERETKEGSQEKKTSRIDKLYAKKRRLKQLTDWSEGGQGRFPDS